MGNIGFNWSERMGTLTLKPCGISIVNFYRYNLEKKKLCRNERLFWDMMLKCAAKACSPLFPSCFTRIWLSFLYSLM